MSKTMTGTVVSNKADKSITVKVDTSRTHPIYKKAYTVSKRFIVHDEKNQASSGDKVLIKETTPISKNKRWTLVKVTEKAQELGSK